jgi:NAD-dependent SIR2 family protein deacetylase
MNCEGCGKPIPKERLKALPETKTCVKCSDVKRKIVLMDFSHKTAGEAIVVPDDPEQVRLAERYHKRSR